LQSPGAAGEPERKLLPRRGRGWVSEEGCRCGGRF